MKRRESYAPLVAASLFLLSTGTAWGQQFSVALIPAAAGAQVTALPPVGTAINASGTVTGQFYENIGNIDAHIFTYSQGITTDLGDGNSAAACSSASAGAGASGINASGAIAATQCFNEEFPTPALLRGGNLTSIGFAAPGLGGVTTAINKSATVVGTIEIPAGSQCPIGNNFYAFRYLSGSATFTNLQPSLQHIGCSSTATSINDAGQIAGSVWDSMNLPHAYIYSKGTAVDLGHLPFVNPPPQCPYSAEANSINANGDVTGYSRGNCEGPEAYIYTNGVMSDVGNLGGPNGSVGNAINSSRQITGQSWTAGNVAQHAFLYTNGTLLDLNSQISSSDAAAYTLVSGVAINDVGQIVAQGYVNSDPTKTATFVLTPAAPATLSVSLSSTSIDGSGNYLINVEVTNTGGAPAAGTTVTAASLVSARASTMTITTLPAALGNLAPGVSAALTLSFPASAGRDGAPATLKWTAKDSGAVARGNLRLTLP